jgi:hypothetical protein
MSYQTGGAPLPGKLQAIAIMQTVIGSLEILGSILGGIYVLVMGILTFGIGLIAIPIPIIFMVIGILSLVSGIKGLQRNPAYGLSLGVGISQICLLLLCDVLSFGCGLATVIILTQPEAKGYYNRA